MNSEWHISSLLVHARAGALDQARHGIDTMPHAEVRISDGKGRLVVLIETPSEGETLACLRRIEELPGVLSAALVYHEVDCEHAERTLS